MVKARVVRHRGIRTPLAAHLAYLRRDGVTREGERGELFGAGEGPVEAGAFAARCEDDRHHFRFIISPEDARDMADLRGFTRALMTQAEADLGTRLDWVAVDHWNTDHPHIHVIVRGHADDGQDLVIGRDYIASGLRARAQALITDELGPRSEIEIRRGLEAQVDAERFTPFDRLLIREAGRRGMVDAAPAIGGDPEGLQPLKAGRLRRLERLGLAEELGAGLWRLADDAETRLRALGERGDIIKQMHQALGAEHIERSQERWSIDGEDGAQMVVGQLVARGLDDELRGSAWAVVDGVDGRAHHLRFDDLDATSDAVPGAIVELRRFDDQAGRRRSALSVRSDLDLATQIVADGATWLDRQLVSGDAAALGGGFGAEVRDALAARADHLLGTGLATRRGERIVPVRGLLDTLRARDLATASARLATETGRPVRAAAAGDAVNGTCARRVSLASGRFAMIDDGLGFTLVPWTPALDRQVGRTVSGVARQGGGVDWVRGRGRGLGV